jgi:hypothetical protein
MRPYAQVQPTFWVRGSGKELRGQNDAQLVCLYLFTGPHSNMIGLYFVSLPVIAHEIGMPVERVLNALDRLHAVDIAHYDQEAELVWLPEGANIQLGRTLAPRDNRRAGLLKELEAVHDHPFGVLFLEKYAAAYHLEAPPQGPYQAPHQAPCQPPVAGGHSLRRGPFGVKFDRAGLLPDPAPAPVPDPALEGVQGEPEQPPPEPDNEHEICCPVTFEPHASAASELRTHLRVSEATLRAICEEFVGYWTIGAGRGKRRANWQARFREHCRKLQPEKLEEFKRATAQAPTPDAARSARRRELVEETRRAQAEREHADLQRCPAPAAVGALLASLGAPLKPIRPDTRSRENRGAPHPTQVREVENKDAPAGLLGGAAGVAK